MAGRVCTDCKKELPTSNFAKNRARKDGLQTICSSCHKVRGAAWRKANFTREYYRAMVLKRYGMAAAEYDVMLVAQGGLCAICRKPSDRTLHVDHDHSCCPERKRSCGMCIRGLLCDRCNVLLGMAKDDILILESAAAYIRGRRY